MRIGRLGRGGGKGLRLVVGVAVMDGMMLSTISSAFRIVLPQAAREHSAAKISAMHRNRFIIRVLLSVSSEGLCPNAERFYIY